MKLYNFENFNESKKVRVRQNIIEHFCEKYNIKNYLNNS